MIFDQFDSIRIINLPYRTDRRVQTERELDRVGMKDDPRVAFFKAYRPEDAGSFSSRGAHGVFKSHLAILEEAAETGHSVLVMEDDVDFISTIQNYILPPEWSIFYGGYEAENKNDLLNSNIIGAHMMGFSAEIVGNVAEYLRNLKFTGTHPPIDGAYIWYRRAFPDVVTVFAEPALAYQRPSRSDIADTKILDRIPLIAGPINYARTIKRALFRK